MKKSLFGLFCCLLLVFGIISIQSCSRKPKQLKTDEIVDNRSIKVNLFIENSGSMKGYFAGNFQIKDIIKEYYDRISETQKSSDTITLNFINTQIENYSDNIKSYLHYRPVKVD